MANLLIFGVIVCLVLKSSKTDALYNFVSKQGIQYYIETRLVVNWYEAMHKCALNNATLAAVESNDKQKDISEMLNGHFTSDITSQFRLWTAGHDNAVEGTFIWFSTGRVLTFTNWASNEPNDGGGKENCIEIRPGDFRWNDVSCSVKMGYICEQKLSVEDTSFKCNETIDDLKKSHNQALNKKQLELKDLKKSHQDDLNTLRQSQQQQLADKDKKFDDSKKSHQEELNTILQKNIDDLEAVKKFHVKVMDDYKHDLANLKKSHENATNVLLEEKDSELNALKKSCALELALALESQQKSCENTTTILVEKKTLELMDQKNQELEDLKANNEKAKILELESIKKSHEDEQNRLRQEKEQELQALQNVCERKSKSLAEDSLQKINELQMNRTNSYKFYNFVFHGNGGNNNKN